MCSDLISRRMVMEFLQQRHAGAIIEGCHAEPAMEEVYGGIQSEVGRIMDFIVQAPDAYDVDRVKEQLEEKAESYGDPASSDEGFRRYCRGIAAGFRYAVSIVEGGGLDGEDIADSFQRRNGSGHSGW